MFIHFRGLGHPISASFLEELAQSITGKDVGRKWRENFLKKKKIVFRIGGAKDVCGYEAENDPQKKESFIAQLEAFFLENPMFPSTNIINIDETNLLLGVTNRPNKTLDVRGSKSVETKKLDKQKSVSLVIAISASGKMFPPAVIYKGVRETENVREVKEYLLEDENNGFLLLNKDGYMMTKSLWMKYFKKLKEKLPEGPLLLIIDGHGSHVSLEFANFCEKNNICYLYSFSHEPQAAAS